MHAIKIVFRFRLLWWLHYNINFMHIKSIQVRVTGNVTELSEPEIADLYKEESLMAKIRSKICRCGEVVDWNELKAKHDETLQNYCDGSDQLPQTNT